MKAIMCTKYRPTECLEFVNVEKPVPKDNEVLVKVHAASLNAADLDWVRGTPMILITGPFKPSITILGSAMAGRVELPQAAILAVQGLLSGPCRRLPKAFSYHSPEQSRITGVFHLVY
jgi:hypothetical protein